MPPKTRRRLAPALERVERGEWREGFKDACEVIEAEARLHLKDGIRRGRLVLKQKSGNPYRVRVSDVDGLTMGQLVNAYAAIQNPTHADDHVLQVMQRVKKDRNAVTHHAREKTTELRLRTNAGRHIWSMATAVQALMGE